MKTEKFSTILIGKESKRSKKDGAEYGVLTIMDGTQPLNIATKDSELFNSLKLYEQYDVQLSVNVGMYTSIDIVSFEPIKDKK